MAKQFLVWKDRNCNGVNPEWLSLTGSEFYELTKKEENKDRFFMRIPPVAKGDDLIIIETTKERFLESEKERKSELRKSKHAKKFKQTHFDFFNEADEIILFELIGNQEETLEESIEESIMLEKLHEALEILSPEEKEVIHLYYFTEGATERSVAEQLNISQPTFNYRKEKTLKKLKDFFYQK